MMAIAMPTRNLFNVAHDDITTSTEYERESLGDAVNLSDGHARQPLTPTQQAIIERSPAIFHRAQWESQFRLESAFVRSFLHLAGEPHVFPPERYFLSYSSSSAIGMIALYCQRHDKSVALIEPIFDNIPNTLRAAGVSLEVLPEEALPVSGLTEALQCLSADVVWIVCPNNPTGHVLDEATFEALVTACARLGKTLVVDFCFRFYAADLARWSQYERLKRSGVSFITIEDTGKTWATLDMKIGMLVCSDDLHDEFYHRHDDLLLNVSPFHLALLTEFIDDTIVHGADATIGFYVQQNLEILREALADSVLSLTGSGAPTVTVAWIRIDADVAGERLWEALRRRNIHILPGSNFYWHAAQRGRSFVRIPLARDPRVMSHAMPIIRSVAAELAAGLSA
jgi:aspartate/methionine/tyrosine aminotransferase